jgi:hypothetical protein
VNLVASGTTTAGNALPPPALAPVGGTSPIAKIGASVRGAIGLAVVRIWTLVFFCQLRLLSLPLAPLCQ